MHKVTPKFPKKHTILPKKLHSCPLFGTLSDCAEPFRRCRRGCLAHRPSLLPDARHRFQPDDAMRCTGHRSALHRSSHRTAFPQAGHSPLPVSPLPDHGFRPRVWPGSLCPLPRLPHTGNERPRCSARNTTASRAREPGLRPAQDRFPIRNALFPSWPAALWSHIVFV